MNVFVTGAGGFLGRATVRAVRARGHTILAMHRPSSPSIDAGEGVTPVSGDLRQGGSWVEALSDAEAVVHCAAATSGDLPSQLAGSVLATENLLAALPPGLKRFVHVSSFSVYDYQSPSRFGRIDERSDLEKRPLRRDAYTQTKLIQEQMVREWCREAGIELVVVRPGAIYGPGLDWNFGAALTAGRFDFIFAPLARMRLVHVDDCAEALALAVDAPVSGERIVNVVADDQPSHWGFHRLAKRAGAQVGHAVPVPYAAVRALGGAAWLASRLFFGGKARLPELLDSPRQRARWRHLPSRADEAANALGWRSRVSFRDGVEAIAHNKHETR